MKKFLFLGCLLFSSNVFANWVQITDYRFSSHSYQLDDTLAFWDTKFAQYKSQYTYVYENRWVDRASCTGNRICARVAWFRWSASVAPEFCPETTEENREINCSSNVPVNACETDTIAGAPIMGGSGAGIYDVGSCAYTCGVNYSKLDGFTSLADAQECVGTGKKYVSSDPSDYSEPPSVCTVKDSLGQCLDMEKQQGGACPAGTTYGRLNDTEVCVPSGTSPDPLDPGSQGLPDQGGDMQAEGTPDRAGTGGSPTGSGTGSTSGTSTTTDNGDGTSTTVSTETKETNGPSTVRGHGDPASWWESQYPDGAAGIASKFSEDVGNGPFMAMLNPLKSLPDGGTAPSWSLDFGIGQMGNYGSHSFELPAGVWAFVRFAILFTTVMTVRKLIFGG